MSDIEGGFSTEPLPEPRNKYSEQYEKWANDLRKGKDVPNANVKIPRNSTSSAYSFASKVNADQVAQFPSDEFKAQARKAIVYITYK